MLRIHEFKIFDTYDLTGFFQLKQFYTNTIPSSWKTLEWQMCARYLVHCCSLYKSKRNQSKYIYKSSRPYARKVHPICSIGMIQMLKIKLFLHINDWSWNEELLSSKCFKFIAVLATISSYSLKSDLNIAFPIVFFPAISIVFWSYKLQITKLHSNNCP